MTVFIPKLNTFPSFFITYLYSTFSNLGPKLEDDGNSLKSIANAWLISEVNYTFDSTTLVPYSPAELETFKYKIPQTLENLKNYRKFVNSEILIDSKNSKYESALKNSAKWEFTSFDNENWDEWEKNSTICKVLKKKFAFFDIPLSVEEAEYSLAYGFLIYKDLEQILYVLSAFYHPQNAYCIAIDDKASKNYKLRMQQVSKCFPNVHVYRTKEKVEWGGRQIPVAVLSCLQKLTDSNHPWKYFQYLTGFDLPLKTNLEMVRIFKALKGTFHASVHEFQTSRYSKTVGAKTPLPLWKSSLSATFSRESAKVIVTNRLVFALLAYLYNGNASISDESIWASVAGNPSYIKMPGGFNAKEFLEKIQAQSKDHVYQINESQPFPLDEYYIPRYQVWGGGKCKGKNANGSCVFGIRDLPDLVIRPELVAHKFYLNNDDTAAAFFCLYEIIRLRALDFKNQKAFDASYYSLLPQVQLSMGKSINEVKFYF